MRDGEHVLFRVERGHPREEELAALTAVLLSLGGDSEEGDEAARPVAQSQWWRRSRGYTAPDSWH